MILGIDQSYTQTGLACVRHATRETITDSISTTAATPWIQRIQSIIQGINTFVNTTSFMWDEALEAIALESYAYAGSSKGFLLGELGGIIKWHCVTSFGLATYQIILQHHKMYVARRGTATKKQTIAGLKRRFDITETNNNKADALSMALLLEATLANRDDETRYDKLLFEKVRLCKIYPA